MFYLQDEQRRHVLDDIRACKEKIDAIKVKANITAETEAGRIYAFLHTLHLLEVELLVEVKEWKRIADVTQVCSVSNDKNHAQLTSYRSKFCKPTRHR